MVRAKRIKKVVDSQGSVSLHMKCVCSGEWSRAQMTLSVCLENRQLSPGINGNEGLGWFNICCIFENYELLIQEFFHPSYSLDSAG
jgi:hypothetical protein